METKKIQEFKEKMLKKVAVLEQKVQKYQEKVENEKGNIQQIKMEKLNQLKSKINKANQAIEQYAVTTKKAYRDIKKAFRVSLKDLEKGFKNAKSRYNKL